MQVPTYIKLNKINAIEKQLTHPTFTARIDSNFKVSQIKPNS